MTIETLEADPVEINQAGIPAPLSRVLRASAAQAWEDLPLLSAIPRAVELDTARKRYDDAYRLYNSEGASAWMKTRGLEGRFTFEADQNYNELELSIMARRKREEIARQSVLMRDDGGIATGALRLGVALGVSVLDPLNVASAFIPVVGEARYARIVERAGGAIGRAGARLTVGAIEGAAGAAAVEPIIYGANLDQQADYTLTDSLLNIGFGTIFGGGLHTTVGAIADVRNRRLIREFDRIVTETAERAVRVEPVAKGEPPRPTIDEAEVRYIGKEVDGYLAGREASLAADAARAPNVKIAESDARLRAVQEQLEPINRALMESRGKQVADEIDRIKGDPDRVLFLRAKYGTENIEEAIEAQAVKAVDARRADWQAQAETLRGQAEAFGGEIADFNRARAAEVDLEQVRLAQKGTLEDKIESLPKELREHMKRRLEAAVKSGIPVDQRLDGMNPERRSALLKAGVGQVVQEQNPRLDGLADGNLSRARQDAAAAAKPDNAPLADPESVRLTDEELAEAGDDIEVVAQRQLEQFEAELKDAVATLGGETQGPLGRIEAGRDLTPEQQEIEVRFAEQLQGDIEKAAADYAANPETKGGKVLNTDEARELSADYRADRSQSAAVHEPASAFIKFLFKRMLGRAPGKGEKARIVFSAGGTGAGKTTGLKKLGRIIDESQGVYDTNMNTLSSAVSKVEQALAAGKEVRIVYTYRDTLEALKEGMLARATRMEKEKGSGRTVPLDEHLKTHIGASQVIRKLVARYGENEKVKFSFIDNSRGKDNAQIAKNLSELPELKQEAYDGLREQAIRIVEKELAEGRISEKTARGVLETPRSDAGGDGLRPGNRGQPEQERAPGSGREDSPAELSEADKAALPEEARAEIDAADEFASQADDYAETARMLVQCALRHAS